MLRFRSWLWVACALASCAEPELELPPPKPNLTPEAAPAAAPASRARGANRSHARVIDADTDLLPGAESDGKRGDLRLENAKAIFIFDAADSALGFADSGGNLIDAVPSDCHGLCRDSLKQIFGSIGGEFPRQPIYERVVPLERGALGVVRAVGHDSAAPAIEIETEYRLAPDSAALEIVTTIKNGSDQPLSSYPVGDAIQWGRSERFAPGFGFAKPTPSPDPLPGGWVAALGEDATYLYVTETASGLRGTHGVAWSDSTVCRLEVPVGESATCRRFFAVLGKHDAIGETVARLRHESWPRIEGHVTEEKSAKPIDGARLLVADHGGRPLGLAQSSAGTYAAVLPPGDYRVRAAGERRGRSEVDVTLRGNEKKTIDFLISRPGTLRFRVMEGGRSTPAKLTFFGAADEAFHLGPAFAIPGGNSTATLSGDGRVQLAPGRYQVVASRGPEFSIDRKQVEVEAGHETEASFALERVVDSHGYLCVDLHQHASPSPDSGVSLRDRAASNLAEGLEVMVPTDHNMIADWQPVLDKLDAARPLRLVLGDEATLDGVGHWNAYPVSVHPDKPRGGALDVRGLDAHQIVAGLRQAQPLVDRVVQVNHPRFFSIGYFNNVRLDPRPGAPLPPGWEGGFDAIEVFSANDVQSTDAQLADWFALLARGLEYTAVGGSDSHLVNGNEVGYPRTCVAVADPSPADLGAALVEGIKHKRDVLVTNGPFVRVSVAGHGMGQLAPAARGKARLDVEVQAAPWIDVRQLEVIVNGERRGRPIELPAAAAGAPFRYRGAVELKVSEDSFVVVEVRGRQPLPVIVGMPGRPPAVPLAITNPIFLDRDLDGKYKAPRATSGVLSK